MQSYSDKEELIAEIRRFAELYSTEFKDIADSDRNYRLEENERTPYENMAYQLGWMKLVQTWEAEEQTGKTPEMPAPGIKWNKLGELHQRFYAEYRSHSLKDLVSIFHARVNELCRWLDTLDDTILFESGGRKWAQYTNSNWPVWKWIHINTVAPFKSFRTKIRKWKKLKSVLEV